MLRFHMMSSDEEDVIIACPLPLRSPSVIDFLLLWTNVKNKKKSDQDLQTDEDTSHGISFYEAIDPKLPRWALLCDQ